MPVLANQKQNKYLNYELDAINKLAIRHENHGNRQVAEAWYNRD